MATNIIFWIDSWELHAYCHRCCFIVFASLSFLIFFWLIKMKTRRSLCIWNPSPDNIIYCFRSILFSSLSLCSTSSFSSLYFILIIHTQVSHAWNLFFQLRILYIETMWWIFISVLFFTTFYLLLNDIMMGWSFHQWTMF